MEETKKIDGGNSNDDLARRLETMEDLLRQQVAQNKRLVRFRGLTSFFMLCLVVVFGAGLIALNNTVAGVTKELPGLIESANVSVQQMKVTMEDISKLDFESMNKAVADMDENISSIDFEALNDAILDLGTAAEGLARLARIF